VRAAPVGWTQTIIGDLCTFASGNGFGPSDWSKSGLPIIRIQNLNGSADFNYFSGEPNPAWVVNPGELLFAWAGVKGVSFGPTIWSGPKGLLNQHIYRVVPKRSITLSFLYLQLLHVTSLIEARAHGFKSNLVHVRKSDIMSQRCYVPPLSEQKAIAAVHTTWDQGVRQLTDLIAAKVRFKQGLTQQLLSGSRRFEECQDGWSAVRLRDVVTECNERNRDRLGANDVMGVKKAEGIVPMRERTIGADVARYLVVQKNWFAYNPMRINIGSIARWQGDGNILVSPDYVVFRCNEANDQSPGIDPDYLDHLRRSGIWENFVTAAGNGSVRVRIYFDDLGGLKFKLPSLPEQQKIATFLNTVDREISLLRKQLETLKSQRKGLMQKLLTGQMRLCVDHLENSHA
jgi:type I restriction enzyme, S subunit